MTFCLTKMSDKMPYNIGVSFYDMVAHIIYDTVAIDAIMYTCALLDGHSAGGQRAVWQVTPPVATQVAS